MVNTMTCLHADDNFAEWEEHMMQEKNRIFIHRSGDTQKVLNFRYEGHQIDEFGG